MGKHYDSMMVLVMESIFFIISSFDMVLLPSGEEGGRAGSSNCISELVCKVG